VAPFLLVKKTLLTVLQVLVTLGLLWFVFRDPTKRAEMLATLRGADVRWLLGGIAIYGVVEFLAGLRWVVLLRVQGVALGVGRTFALLLIGVFFNFFFPSGAGGDVVKIYYLLKETHGQRAAALLSVLVDRILGLIGLILLAGLIVAWRWDWLMSTPTTAQGVWTTLFILSSAIFGIAFSFIVTGFGLVHRLPARFPGRERLAELAVAYNLYARAWRHSLTGLALSLVSHIGYFAVFYCAARSFRGQGVTIPSLADLTAVMPVVNTIAAMPISLGGLGVREGLFQVFLGQLCGVSEAVAVLISSTGYLLTLVWGIIGGAVYLCYRPSEHARMRDIRVAVAKAEHTIAEKELAAEKRA
jgi:glycosyltransferase 2 family protein